MKMIALPCLWAFLVLAYPRANAEESDELFVWAKFEGDPNGTIPDTCHQYFVKWSQIPSKTRWVPGAEPFPLDLHAEVLRACNYLSGNEHPPWPNLNEVRIRRLCVPNQLAEAHGKPTAEFTNQWLVALSFLTKSNYSTDDIVMLLDGVYATQRSVPLAHPIRRLRSGPGVQTNHYRPLAKPPDKWAFLNVRGPEPVTP